MNDDVGLEVLPYEFEPSAALLTDFWNEVDRILPVLGTQYITIGNWEYWFQFKLMARMEE